MYQLTGEYECSVDAKGRLRLPAALVRQLDEKDALSFVINRGFEKCLMLYPRAVWDRKVDEISKLNIFNTKLRNFTRYFYRGATKLQPDSADRILLPKNLLKHAIIEKDVILFAYHEQVEIWDKQSYEQMLDQEPDEFAALAEEVFGGDFSAGLSDE